MQKPPDHVGPYDGIHPNTQPISKVVKKATGTYEIHSIFHTIQGEGPFCGRPAVFVRMFGCNLQCPKCDTEYTKRGMRLTAEEVVNSIRHHAIQDGGLVVLTGGEPFRQPIGPLIEAILAAKFTVQVETNGTLAPPAIDGHEWQTNVRLNETVPRAYIVCSPKTGKINDELLARACCLKYVVSQDDRDPDDGLPNTALGHTANPRLPRPPWWWDRPVYIQPADHQDPAQNQANMEAAVTSAMQYGYTLQLQIHKYIGVE